MVEDETVLNRCGHIVEATLSVPGVSGSSQRLLDAASKHVSLAVETSRLACLSEEDQRERAWSVSRSYFSM